MNLSPFPQNGQVGESPVGAVVDAPCGAEGIKLGGAGGSEVTVGCVPDGGPESAAGGDPAGADGGPDGNFPFFLLPSNPSDLAALPGLAMKVADLPKKNERIPKKKAKTNTSNPTIKIQPQISRSPNILFPYDSNARTGELQNEVVAEEGSYPGRMIAKDSKANTGNSLFDNLLMPILPSNMIIAVTTIPASITMKVNAARSSCVPSSYINNPATAVPDAGKIIPRIIPAAARIVRKLVIIRKIFTNPISDVPPRFNPPVELILFFHRKIHARNRKAISNRATPIKTI